MLLFCFNAVLFCGRLAQLARASRLHREGQEFESLTAYQFKVAVLTAAFFMSKEPERVCRAGVVVLWVDNGFGAMIRAGAVVAGEAHQPLFFCR